MSEPEFVHLVAIDVDARLLRIYRIFPDGHKHLFTETPLPPRTVGPKDARHAEFARLVGENILLDSPAARRALGW